MYQTFKEAGYDIEIKKILEFKHEAIFRNYVEYLYSKKKNMLYKIKNLWSYVLKL